MTTGCFVDMTEYSNTEVTDSTYDVETLPTPAPEANDYDKLIFVENQLLRIFVKRIQIMDGLYLLGPGQGQQFRGGSFSFPSDSNCESSTYRSSLFLTIKNRQVAIRRQ